MSRSPRLQPLHRPAPPDVGTERLHKEMGRWRRRSTLIHFWRRALPFAIAMICVAVGGWVVGRTLFGPKRGATSNPVIRMVNPHFYGRDKSGRAYVVVADSAVRAAANPEDVTLANPRLTLGVNLPPPTKVNGDHGLYNETSKILKLSGHVLLDDGKGTIFRSESAVIDTNAGEVQGSTPVAGAGPLGQITASSYAIHDRGDDIVFIGSVKSHLNNKK